MMMYHCRRVRHVSASLAIKRVEGKLPLASEEDFLELNNDRGRGEVLSFSCIADKANFLPALPNPGIHFLIHPGPMTLDHDPVLILSHYFLC